MSIQNPPEEKCGNCQTAVIAAFLCGGGEIREAASSCLS